MRNRNKRIWPYIEPPPRSPLILDNIGITVPLKNLDGWEEFRGAQRELFGVGWLSRFWKGWIYPVVKPKRYQERKKRFETAQNRMRQELLTAVLEKASETA